MSKQSDKLMTDFHRLLESQEFKTEADLRAFMDSIMGKQIPSFPKEALSLKEQAQDLVFEAYDLPPAKAKIKINEALKLDPDSIEAYEFLGLRESNVENASFFFQKGISIGRKIFGGKFLEENKGFFWGLHETRPFMRCMYHYSDCLKIKGNVKECVAILEELIELNPNDNQGVRDQLLLYLIELDERVKFRKYAKIYKEDGGAFAEFNRALFAFKTEGETEKANKQLQNALKQNKFVAKKLISKKPITNLPNYYGIGDENEANYYVCFAQKIWHKTTGAIAWLNKFSTKS